MEFLYKIGEECWLVRKGFGIQVYQVEVLAQILEKTAKGDIEQYRVKLNYNYGETICYKWELFDIATRSKEALTKLTSILSDS